MQRIIFIAAIVLALSVAPALATPGPYSQSDNPGSERVPDSASTPDGAGAPDGTGAPAGTRPDGAGEQGQNGQRSGTFGLLVSTAVRQCVGEYRSDPEGFVEEHGQSLRTCVVEKVRELVAALRSCIAELRDDPRAFIEEHGGRNLRSVIVQCVRDKVNPEAAERREAIRRAFLTCLEEARSDLDSFRETHGSGARSLVHAFRTCVREHVNENAGNGEIPDESNGAEATA